MELRELLHRANASIALPEVYHRARALSDDPHGDDGHLARIVETDPSLAGRLLRIVNSPLYGLPRPVDRVSQALALVGKRALRDLILAIGVARSLGRIPTPLVDTSTFWHHSIYCGLIARQLARRCAVLHGERLLMAGLLHDIGQLVLYQCLPGLSARALARADHTDDGLHRAERETFGYTHGEVGAELLKDWRFPEALQAVVRHHHEPDEAGPHLLEASILHLANSIANRLEPSRAILICESGVARCAWTVTGLSEDAVGSLLREADAQFLSTLNLLFPARTSV
jgi:putative nucleotidyltransferase with HDIG domain